MEITSHGASDWRPLSVMMSITRKNAVEPARSFLLQQVYNVLQFYFMKAMYITEFQLKHQDLL